MICNKSAATMVRKLADKIEAHPNPILALGVFVRDFDGGGVLGGQVAVCCQAEWAVGVTVEDLKSELVNSLSKPDPETPDCREAACERCRNVECASCRFREAEDN